MERLRLLSEPAEFDERSLQREGHRASADALATAELALILFSKARQQGLDSLPALLQQLNSRRCQLAHSM